MVASPHASTIRNAPVDLRRTGRKEPVPQGRVSPKPTSDSGYAFALPIRASRGAGWECRDGAGGTKGWLPTRNQKLRRNAPIGLRRVFGRDPILRRSRAPKLPQSFLATYRQPNIPQTQPDAPNFTKLFFALGRALTHKRLGIYERHSALTLAGACNTV